MQVLTKNKKSKHGMSRTRIYRIYEDMLGRCLNPNSRNYKHYGGREIHVCEEWRGSDGFINFYNWSVNHGYSKDLQIDRIDVNGNYCPSNCRWSDRSVQNANKRNRGKCEYIGVFLHSSGSLYTTMVKHNGKRVFIYSSNSKNDCAAKRNEFIISSGLDYPLNEIIDEYEDIRPRRQNLWIAVDKSTGVRVTADTLDGLSKKVGLTSQFIYQCVSGKRKSRTYTFLKDEK